MELSLLLVFVDKAHEIRMQLSRSRNAVAWISFSSACSARFGMLRPAGAPVLRSDNGFTFKSRRFRKACRHYRLTQKFITPYTPEQDGIIERFIRSLKGEYGLQQLFGTFEEARRVIRA